jgi:hypothetical protein
MKSVNANVTLRDVFVEFVSHFDNLLFLVPAVAMMAGIMVVDPGVEYLLWFLLGWAVFVPQEYFTHVYILHPRVPKSKWAYRMVYRLHYGHHDLPRRHDLMYMPLWLTLPMALTNMALFSFITHSGLQWMASVSGLFTGYLVFEFSHLMCHLPYQPKTKLGKTVRRRHLWHHYHNERHWYAVSFVSLFMDTLLNSAGDKADVPKSATASHLGIAADHPWLLAARQYYAERSTGNTECSRLWVQQK